MTGMTVLEHRGTGAFLEATCAKQVAETPYETGD